MSDRDLRLLGALDPAPSARTAGAAGSAWGRATLDRIVAGEVRPARGRRPWPALAAAGGVIALVALFVALIVATGGGSASGTAETVVTAPGVPSARLDEVAATIRRRADLLGADDVTVARRGDRIVVTQPEDADPLPLARGRLTVRGLPLDPPASRGAGPVPPGPVADVGVRSARATDERNVLVEPTAAGAAAFRDLTRTLVRDAALRTLPDAMFAVDLDGTEVTRARISVADYPNGIDGANGIDLLTDGPSPRVVAALLATPLPDLDVRPARGWTSYAPAP